VFQEDLVAHRGCFGLIAALAIGILGTEWQTARAATAPAAQPAPPSLQGVWQQEAQSVMFMATTTHVAFFGVDGLPGLNTYEVNGDQVVLQPLAAGRSFNDAILEDDLGIKSARGNTTLTLTRFEPGSTTTRFVTPDGITRTWRRLE
jgi:hypothetical protein